MVCVSIVLDTLLETEGAEGRLYERVWWEGRGMRNNMIILQSQKQEKIVSSE